MTYAPSGLNVLYHVTVTIPMDNGIVGSDGALRFTIGVGHGRHGRHGRHAAVTGRHAAAGARAARISDGIRARIRA